MKTVKLLLITITTILTTSLAISQDVAITEKTINSGFNSNISKGKSQIAIEGINFGIGYGRIIGSLGLRYGYFVADNNLIFINCNASYWGGNELQNYNLGINYRRYFNTPKVNPYVQIGTNIGWERYIENTPKTYYDVTIGTGVCFQLGKFGFEIGLQLNVWDKVTIMPTVGVTYTF